MKNTFRLIGVIAVAALIGFTMIACGGGGYKKSGLSTDGFFGALPGLYADKNLAFDSAMKKYDTAKEKAEKKMNFKAVQKAEDQFKKEYEKIDSDFDPKIAAEREKLSGKDVPFITSANFAEFKVNSLKVGDDGELVLSASDARSNLIGVTSFKFRALAKDGSVIIEHVNYGSDKVYIQATMTNDPEKWVDFEKIEFLNAM